MRALPACGSHLLRWQGDGLEVELRLDAARRGRAVCRTEIGGAAVARRETVALNDEGRTRLERAWRDLPLAETEPGVWRATIPLDETGVFRGKCAFFPEGSSVPEWPEGDNFTVKVEPAETRAANAIYTVFPRQFGSFREVARRLDFIMGKMGFDIIQTLPVFPVPVTYAVMGEYGCPFAATDFFSVDPALAEFDTAATPLDQFRELIAAVHARNGRLFIDLPANHTGWASTLQTHHPDWFQHAPDGHFVSPGAWGVTWADLVALDYAHPQLRAYMAEVFLFWVRNGVDGFRCDAGYMIPADTWEYIVARVREEYPDTVFMLEGLGGRLEVTDALLNRAGLDWAYSEIFQTYDRAAFERYLPGAVDRARRFGTLVHFAETHDNDRLATRGPLWARLRVAIAALLSHQGAWGIANGVEWFATEKIDVHGKNDLNWGATANMVALIARLNDILHNHPDFAGNGPVELIEEGDGNFLAVLRGGTLVLANLDCGQGVTAHWNLGRFAAGVCRDLLTDQNAVLGTDCPLEPGGFRVFTRTPYAKSAPPPMLPAAEGCVPWTAPDDFARRVCIPNGMTLRVTAPRPFRVRLQAGTSTRAVKRSTAWRTPEGAEVHAADLATPPYSGDGTHTDDYELVLTDYAQTGVTRRSATVCVAPPGELARVCRVWTGAAIRSNLARPGADGLLETVLSDGAGSAARVKLAWGEIRSQYDAFLAADPNPRVPADRLVLWTRCRAWLQYEGYSREINADCIDSFRADPSGRAAEWVFSVPCGLGRVAKFRFRLALAQDGSGTATLAVRRLVVSANDDVGAVTLVFRPDLEWRSFHATTKAQGAVEQAFAGATNQMGASGFAFSPYGKGERLEMALSRGRFHPEGEWTYCVSHAEEAARGQDGCGDLYSPGWMDCAFAVGGETVLSAVYRSPARTAGFDSAAAKRLVTERGVPEEFAEPLMAVDEALCEALKLFIVRRDDVKTVIAGYPWFLDWGRDTFIFLQGAIPAGFRAEALAIVEAFARFEENGTLPNIIYGETAGNRDTVDAQLWFIRTLEILGKDGERFRPVAESIVDHYLHGTPNGIRVDGASGLVWTPAHFTWMDTNYPACTPRCGYPVEIQALWIDALWYTRRTELAARAAASFMKLFVRTDAAGGLYDCLDAPDGEPAAEARPDGGVRPNQLLAVTLGIVPAESPVARAIVAACARLVIPGGVRSLAPGDGRYRGTYAGDEDTSRKPAYHNGTVWAWPFPLYAEAAVKCGALTRAQGLSLLATAVDNLNAGCVCHLSENADGDAPHAQKGCRAQAWSASELLRVWLWIRNSK